MMEEDDKHTPSSPEGGLYPALEEVSSETISSEPHKGDEVAHTSTKEERQEDMERQLEKNEGLFGDVKAGFFSLWSAIPTQITEKVTSVVGGTSDLLKSGISHVQEVGIIQGAKDGVKTTVELAETGAKATLDITKKVDETYLHGRLSSLAQSTMTITKTGVEKVKTTTSKILAAGQMEENISAVITTTDYHLVQPLGAVVEQMFGPLSTLRAVPSRSDLAEQPVGYAAARLAASKRIDNIALVGGTPPSPGEVVISMEGFLQETTPGCWFHMYYVILFDPEYQLQLETISQGLQVPEEYIARAKASTPADYPHAAHGFAVTPGMLMQQDNGRVDPTDWHKEISGICVETFVETALTVVFGQYCTVSAARKEAEREEK